MHKINTENIHKICSNKIKQNHKILAPALNISKCIKFLRLVKIVADA